MKDCRRKRKEQEWKIKIMIKVINNMYYPRTSESKDNKPSYWNGNRTQNITDNYKNDDDIVAKTGDNIENVLDFDRNGRYEFVHCGSCGGPILGHKE